MANWRAATRDDEAFLYALFAEDRRAQMPGVEGSALTMLIDMQYRGRAVSYAKAYPEAKELILLNAEGNAAGHLLLNRGPQCWRIVDLAVAQAHRNQGMGTRALQECQRQVADAGCDLALQVAPGNPARRLYARLGFHAVREDAVTVEMVWYAAKEEQASRHVSE